MGEFQIQEVELTSCQPRHPTRQQRHRHRHRQRQHRQRHAPTARAASGVDTACGQALGSTSVSPGPTEMRTRPARRSPSQLLACSSNGGSGGGSERVGVGGGGGQCRGRGEKGSRLLAQSRASSSGTSGVQQRCAVASVLAKAYGLATECAAPLLACLPLLLHSSKAARLAGVGGAARKTFLPLITWYHTASSTAAIQQRFIISGVTWLPSTRLTHASSPSSPALPPMSTCQSVYAPAGPAAATAAVSHSSRGCSAGPTMSAGL